MPSEGHTVQDSCRPELQTVETRAYTPESEASVLAILQSAFGRAWGDRAFWRWKHLQRPGFCAQDVRVYRSADKVIGCWHMAARPLRLAPGLEIPASVESDYAMHPDWRGVGMGRDPATLKEARALAERGIVARFAFTSPRLYARVYRPKLGYRRIPAATRAYHKLVSDQGVRERLQRLGQHLQSRALVRRLVRERPLVIEVEVEGFERCMLALESGSARCVARFEAEPDLRLCVPYELFAARTIAAAAGAAGRALLRGKLRTRRMARFTRWLASALVG